VGVTSQVFKAGFIQKDTRNRVYKNLAPSMLTYGSEACIVYKRDESRITSNHI